MTKNANLHNARRAKDDEFYTQYEDIQKEIRHYTDHFKDKVVMCNCDDPLESNFTKYFILRFKALGLKKLICTFYDVNNVKQAFAFVYEGQDLNGDGVINEKDIELIRKSKAFQTPLVDDEEFDIEKKEECWKKGIYGSGDFRSKNVIAYLKQADIVVTNPPFSLFREYVAQLMEYEKKFLIVGNQNAITYKEIFPYIKNNQLWLGAKGIGDMAFVVPQSYEMRSTRSWKGEDGTNWRSLGNACWFTNIDHEKRHEEIPLFKEYTAEEYPHYDNYDAIECGKVENIPMDYDGVIGVPITFLGKYCPEQFEIVKFRKGNDDKDLSVNGKCPYFRILIKRKSSCE